MAPIDGAGGPDGRVAGPRPRQALTGSGMPAGRSDRAGGSSRPSFREMVKQAPADGSRPPEGADEAARLAWAARELEAFFLQELWRAMRRSVPEGGLFRGAPGSRMFEEMLDEERSRLMAASDQLGLAALIYERTLPYVLRNGGTTGAVDGIDGGDGAPEGGGSGDGGGSGEDR